MTTIHETLIGESVGSKMTLQTMFEGYEGKVCNVGYSQWIDGRSKAFFMVFRVIRVGNAMCVIDITGRFYNIPLANIFWIEETIIAWRIPKSTRSMQPLDWKVCGF